MEFLYRYLKFKRQDNRLTDWENKRLERIFTQNELYFQSPTEFNDPFDCKTLFTFEGSGDDDFRKFFYGVFKYKLPNLSREAIKRKVEEEIIQKRRHEDPQWRRDQIENWLTIQVSENAKLGMLCLSEKRDDILMWSHYADGHTGFCLEFDKEGLKSWTFCDPIQYQKPYPTFKEFVDSIDSQSLSHFFLLRKSDHWGYEKEWRAFANCENPVNRYLKFQDHLLTGVIWGCQMPEENKAMICRWRENRKIRPKLYQSKKKGNEYGLTIEEIN